MAAAGAEVARAATAAAAVVEKAVAVTAAKTAAEGAVAMAMVEGESRGRGDRREGLGECRTSLGFQVYSLATIWLKVEQCF